MSDFDAEFELQNIYDETSDRALEYLEREAPKTLTSIKRLVFEGRWSGKKIWSDIKPMFEDTEPRVQHKIKLAIARLIRERDEVQ